MERFFNPSSIAVIGASRDESKGGNIIIRNLVNLGYKGKIFPSKPIIFSFMKEVRERVFRFKKEAEDAGAPVFFSINEAFSFISALCKWV